MGIVYINVPLKVKSEDDFAHAMLKSLGWYPDPVIDGDGKCS